MLAEHLINGTPLVEGWLETPTEVVTAENVDDYVLAQTDNQVQYDYYQEYMAENFADLEAAARPYDDLRTPGDAARDAGAVAQCALTAASPCLGERTWPRRGLQPGTASIAMTESTATTDDEIIRLDRVTKRFGGITAVNDVSFGIRRGEIHAVVGENGAGKSTIMKMLAGVYQPGQRIAGPAR